MSKSRTEVETESDVYIANPVTKSFQEFYRVSIVDVAKAFIADHKDSIDTYFTRMRYLTDHERDELKTWISNYYADYFQGNKDLTSYENVREQIFLLHMHERMSMGDLQQALDGYKKISATEPLANY